MIQIKAFFYLPVLICVLTPFLAAQSVAARRITVEDSQGEILAGATIANSQGKVLGHTDESGQFSVSYCATPCRLEVSAPRFVSRTIVLRGVTTVRLQAAGGVQQITVTAYRTPLGELESPASTRVISRKALKTSAAVTLDGKLREVPGFELFRRSSSLVANPTSQGISLRGLGSTAASRTLVMEDDVPLNDPIGGWIHWNEEPELAIRDVEVVRGGASDLYGSSAIGGVISVIPVRPTTSEAELRSSYGGEGTFDDSLLAQTVHGPWGFLLAGGAIGTDGYIMLAPQLRGPIDRASNVHSQNALALIQHRRGSLRLFARVSEFNESRHNGTPYQMNATRLVRYSTGADWQNARNRRFALRLYGSRETYRQTFSAVNDLSTAVDPGCSYRCGESPAKLTRTSDNELGGAANWSQPLGAGLLLMAGADTHDVRVWDREQVYAGAGSLTQLHDHQRDSAPWAEMMWVHHGWTVIGSGRYDWFQNFDAHQLEWTGTAWVPSAEQPPQRDERLFDPRLGISRKLSQHVAVSASGYRAFRAPTPSELYRSFRVGDKVTKANGNLLSERATGWEAGVATQWHWGVIRTSYFLTQVNRPITAVTLKNTPSLILLMRENIGQIESRGVSVDFELAPRPWLAVDGGYQYAHATVTRGTQDYGKWIPAVARNMATLNLRASKASLGTLSLQSRLSGRQYDDDANLFLLHGYFRLDAYAAHDFGSRFEVFAAAENLLDRSIEVAKTPETRLGMPRVARFGFLIRFGKGGR